jgi:hypothetical protein
MITFLSQSWPWYVSGPAIALVLAILLFSGKTFGFSANLTNICSMMGFGGKVNYFKFDWKSQHWNLWFLAGSIVGGYIAAHYLQSPQPLSLSAATVADLRKLNIPFDGNIEPGSIFNWSYLLTGKGLLLCRRLHFRSRHNWTIQPSVAFVNRRNRIFYRRIICNVYSVPYYF